jgi:hypothetical protein
VPTKSIIEGMKIGKKTKEWIQARKRLEKEYLENGITKCEICHSDWALSFHHLDKRSSGKAKHTFKDTRLLCNRCHDLAEYSKELNEKLRQMR